MTPNSSIELRDRQTLQPGQVGLSGPDPQTRSLVQHPIPERGPRPVWRSISVSEQLYVELILRQRSALSTRSLLGQTEVRVTETEADSVEMDWLSSHAAELSVHRGEWLLIVGRELIAHHTDFDEIQKTIQVRGIKSPFVYYVPKPEEENFVF